jgi:phage recombination protein Bet
MNTSLTTTSNGALSFGFDSQKVQLIKDKLCPKADNNELALFLMQCQRTGLDPFAKQIYLIGRWDSRLSREVHSLQVSIDGARLIAQRSGEYAGQTTVYWCGNDGAWKDIWLSSDKPAAAKVGVYRKGFVEPLWAVALWSSYCQTDKNGKVTHMWDKFSSLMLGKVAEMLALRRAFPMELSGLYSGEEMDQSTKLESIPADVVQPKPQLSYREGLTQAVVKSNVYEEQPAANTYKGTDADKIWLAAELASLGFKNDGSKEYKQAGSNWHQWSTGKSYDVILKKLKDELGE